MQGMKRYQAMKEAQINQGKFYRLAGDRKYNANPYR